GDAAPFDGISSRIRKTNIQAHARRVTSHAIDLVALVVHVRRGDEDLAYADRPSTCPHLQRKRAVLDEVHRVAVGAILARIVSAIVSIVHDALDADERRPEERLRASHASERYRRSRMRKKPQGCCGWLRHDATSTEEKREKRADADVTSAADVRD